MTRHRMRNESSLVAFAVAAFCLTVGLLSIWVPLASVAPADAAPIAPISTECPGGEK